ncbi:phosphoribosylformylglycinamidine synthase subunit PurS [Nocardioides sp. CFH 31398]|uniref:phosphoribosylformylglycinamidine synthase subunit PurS n=1 Tax=Nocardioides sp. CFH 31398 TaxID=2919579 RepID=UPI001F067D82|nr:phosphoribosylformylglycinamidine synthase subunit PurS [Nocardioides sp. CFH 31398]MCH1865115.1 phosphoribosylformylglycinamidine synthase subunit PurS [Nocardioides sp. CFH 31398]
MVAPLVTVVVDVMPKPEILDPQGKAVSGALARLGFAGVDGVRQGKRFELLLEADADGSLGAERLAEVEQMAATLLSNPVIEDYRVHVEQAVAQTQGVDA